MFVIFKNFVINNKYKNKNKYENDIVFVTLEARGDILQILEGEIIFLTTIL